jgi:hypothetical protein
LPKHVVLEALARGADEARRMQRAGLIHSAYLALQGESCVVASAQFIAPSRSLARGLA